LLYFNSRNIWPIVVASSHVAHATVAGGRELNTFSSATTMAARKNTKKGDGGYGLQKLNRRII
jgi:hypothetical protein